MNVIISYDISDDKRRTKIAKILEGYGYRVQYSVFECELDKKKLAEVKRRLRPLVRKADGESVRFYPLTADTAKRVFVMGDDQARTLGTLTVV